MSLDLATPEGLAALARTVAPTLTAPRIWSPEQRAIFSDVASGSGHTVVTAMPGAGKTTSIVEALSYIPTGKRTLMLAFNKKIADELSSRVPRTVEVMTTHSYGYSLCRKANPRIKVDKYKGLNALARAFAPVTQEKFAPPGADKLLALAKANLCETVDDVLSLLSSSEVDTGKIEPAVFAAKVSEAMDACFNDTSACDFDDMIWLPVAHNLGGGAYARVVIDELQDFTDAQTELSLRAVKADGRILAVGDPRQSISTFRGAHLDSMERVIARLEASVLSLPVSYRCARAIVAEAASVVPEIRSAPDAREGMVTRTTINAMVASALPGDFIISRVNAPLVSLCFAFLAEGRKANVAGRDIGKSLRSLIERGQKRKDVDSLPSFLAWLSDYTDSEKEKLHAAKKDSQALEDKIDCIHALCNGSGTVSEVLDKCDSLFSDDTDDLGKIVLTSTHKAKGLERERAFVLADTYRKRPGLEEDNLYYVAVTRAKNELFLVRKDQAA